MAGKVSQVSDVPRIIFSNVILGLSGFWKVSALSKTLLLLRDDPGPLGLGCVLPGLASISEREAVWGLIDDCFDRDNVKALRQLLALNRLTARFPFLLRRVLGINPRARSCISFLSRCGVTPSCGELAEPLDDECPLNVKDLCALLESGAVHPDAWVEVPQVYAGLGDLARPLLVMMIVGHKFDCVEALLNAGARVDVCEWSAEVPDENPRPQCRYTPPRYSECHEGPLHALISACACLREGDDSEERMGKRLKALVLLKRVAELSKEFGSLHWTTSEYMSSDASPLTLACQLRDPEAVKVLLAVQGGKVDTSVRCDLPTQMLRECYGPDESDESDESDDSDDAAVAEIIEALAEAGANLNQADRKGVTPFVLARKKKLPKTALALIANGVLLDLDLMAAIKKKDAFLVSVILQREVESETGENPLTELSLIGGDNPRLISPLQAALEVGLPYESIKLLIEKGARCPLSVPPAPGGLSSLPVPLSQLSPLLIACDREDENLIRLLCKEGKANPNIPGKAKAKHKGLQYPLLYVIDVLGRRPSCATETLVEILVKCCGADMNKTRSDGHCALSLACRRKMRCTVERLIELGASVEGVGELHEGSHSQRGRKRLPLNEALIIDSSTLGLGGGESEYKEFAQSVSEALTPLLLDKGADPNARGLVAYPKEILGGEPIEVRATPLQVATACIDNPDHRWKMVKMIIERGSRCALPSAPTEESASPLGPAAACDDNNSPSLPPLSKVSPLMLAIRARDSPLLAALCNEGRADPNQCGHWSEWADPELPLAAALTDRRLPVGHSRGCCRMLKRKQWNVVKQLVQAGADPGLLSTHWKATSFDRKIHWGSGSWLADLISLREAHGSLLLQIIQSVPLEELQEPQVGDCSAWHCEQRGDMSPLIAAIRSAPDKYLGGLESDPVEWSLGALALLHRGVDVGRRNRVGGQFFSPLEAVFHAENASRWNVARELIQRGAELSSGEKIRIYYCRGISCIRYKPDAVYKEDGFAGVPRDILCRFWPDDFPPAANQTGS
uniref:Uncharacterized protein n=1 Tax=Chromera velia CCMP2878 TaxID=1169474 RepID=A0A0G4HHP4_9ALVE|eukprot:Cvel_27689.t1-p1 / transcript=Cvel_27689.t1 / gene=Cvel_27689 / organism=Chromera_velia_CCMP2878 / gene_product=hypothetical protein / transcript_product=hypothetical protein / location=Cvel_scaffold3495:4112-7647(+) / protein_length=1024 / sequence_SO=supercontig / SO=protein_coding / is_pseudo=false